MITLTSALDKKMQFAFRKNFRLTSLVVTLIGLIGAIAFIVMGINRGEVDAVVVVAFASLTVIGIVYYFVIVNACKKAAALNYVNEYVFDEQVLNVTTTKNGEVIGTQKVYYKDVVKVKETDDYIFIYVTKAMAFVVAKNSASDADLASIKSLLSSNR